jgi:hypothetical protein
MPVRQGQAYLAAPYGIRGAIRTIPLNLVVAMCNSFGMTRMTFDLTLDDLADPEKFAQACSGAFETREIVLDTETTGLDLAKGHRQSALALQNCTTSHYRVA